MSKMDPGSNYINAEGLTALSRTVDTYYTAAIDHVNAECASFFVSCGVFDTSLVATVQTSDTLDSGYADQTADGSGNDVSLTLADVGSGTLNVPQPLNRYSRIKLVLGGTCVASVVNISGPLLNKEPDATS